MVTEKETTEIKKLINEALEEDRRKRHRMYLRSFIGGSLLAMMFFMTIVIFFIENFSFASGVVGGFLLFFEIWLMYELINM